MHAMVQWSVRQDWLNGKDSGGIGNGSSVSNTGEFCTFTLIRETEEEKERVVKHLKKGSNTAYQTGPVP